MSRSLQMVLALAAVVFPWPVLAEHEGDMPMAGHQHHTAAIGPDARLGTLSFPNSGRSTAQAPFLRGVKLLHNFEYKQAIDAFQEAQKADPGFALAYWGEAMAHNYTLWSNQQTADARAALARLGPTPEARAAKAPTARERMWMAAVETLYGSGTKFERDIAYADKMDALHAAYPDDLEARVFDALASLGRSHGTRDTAGYMKGAALLEEVFPEHRDHPGVVHYLIHAYDDPAHAPLGMRAARLYDSIAPDSAHALHMTSHIFLALGMWPEVERANRAALAVMASRLRARGMPTLRTACGHGPNWLIYSLYQQGKDATAEVAACGVAAMNPAALAKSTGVIGGVEDDVGGYTDMLVRQGIETGRWAIAPVLPEGHFMMGRFNLAYGALLAARRDPARARAAVAEMRRSREAISAAIETEMPDDSQTLPWLDRAIGQGDAVVLLANGNRDEGLAALRACVAAEALIPPPFGPPVLQKPSAELLGDELLAAGQKAGAASAYQSALAAAPSRRLSLAGLKIAQQP